MDIEAELLKTVPAHELEGLIGERICSFHGLLTREVALRLIAKEKGLLKAEDKRYRLADIPKGEKRVSFTAGVRAVWPIAAYQSGRRSRVIEVGDETGQKPLVLWNDDVSLANGLRTRDEISVRGAYEKNGELHLGYSGTFIVTAKAAFSELSSLSVDGSAHIRGFVSSVEGMDTFVRDGKTARGFSFMISDGSSERRCVMYGKAANIEAGDEIIIEDAHIRKGDIEILPETRILSRRAKDMLIGEVGSLDCEGAGIVVDVGGKKAGFGRAGALRFLGVDAADDISISTVVALKKDSLINRRIAFKI